MRPVFRIAPEQVIAVAGLATLTAIAAVLWLATRGPSLGLQWRAAGDDVAIAGIAGTVSVPALQPGMTVAALIADDRYLPLTAADITPEPDATHVRAADYRAFLARQDALWHALSADHAALVLADDTVVSVPVRAGRPPGELPWTFWVQLLCGAGGLLAGATVWAYRQSDPAARYYAITGLGLAAAALSAAVYSSRELALPLATFEALHIVNQTGTLLYTAAFVAVLWHYPRRLGSLPLGPILFAIYAVVALAAAFYWLPDFNLSLRMPVLAGFLGAILLGVRQWRVSRGEPLARAGLRWFLFSWFFGSTLFLALVFVPPIFGIDASSAQAPAFLLLLVIHLALAVGILRYRLFELDRWWGRAWLLAVSGLMVYGLDFLLIHAIGLSGSIALPLSLAVVGWLYFPVRQWFAQWLSGFGRSGRPVLVRMVTDALSRLDREPDRAWADLLSQVYRPGDMSVCEGVSADRVHEGGLALDVAGDDDRRPRRLRYCQRGARLFRREDLALLTDLRGLFGEILGYRGRLRAAVVAERDRVARDLHDDVGARLLTLVNRLDAPQAEQVRTALSELRSVIYSMGPERVVLADAMGDWRAEVAERCEAAAVQLQWRLHDEPPEITLSGTVLLALTRVLRESVTNAIRHARPERLTLDIRFDDDRMDCVLRHRYDGPPPQAWRESLGLHNLRERMARQGGYIRWRYTAPHLETVWSVALTPDEPGGAADATR